jgi:putative flavoprotein involved in K+ transport
VSGARGGETIDFRRLAAQGITLVGLTKCYRDGHLTFASDLADNIARGDVNYLSLLDEADAYAARIGLDLPEEPEARKFAPTPGCVTNPILLLDPRQAGISSIIWATGYASDYSWLQVAAFDEHGKPNHQRGVSSEPGIYFLGLPWLSGRGSSFIWGVWHDAKYIADHIVTQRRYLDYHYSRQRTTERRPGAVKPGALAGI